MMAQKIMKLFKNFFKGNKLNANEIALQNNETGKYKSLDTVINEIQANFGGKF